MLTDLSDRPFRRRRAPRRSRILRRLASPFPRIRAGLSRVAAESTVLLTDFRERRSGAEGRLIRTFGDAPDRSARSVAIYAHYAPFSGVSDMVVAQLRDYARLGFRIVFVTASPTFTEADFARIGDVVGLAIHRSNYGLDFGSWVDALSAVPGIAEDRDELLLVNDSVLGPLHPLDPVLAQMRAGGEGLFGMTDSVEYAPHLQSYFLLARGAPAIADTVAFLRSRRLSAGKRRVIRRFEVALSEHMRTLGHRVAALWGYDQLEDQLLQSEEEVAALFTTLSRGGAVGGPGWQSSVRRQLLDLPLNPVHFFGGLLVRRCGFPFLKAELVLRNPLRIAEAVDWRSLLPPESPVALQTIEDHLAAYERPARSARLLRMGPPGNASALVPPEPSPPANEPAVMDPVWRQTLRAAWTRPEGAAESMMTSPDLDARDILSRVSRFPLVISFSHDDYAEHCGGVQNVVHMEQVAFAAEGLSYLHVSPISAAGRLAAAEATACFSLRLDGTILGTATVEALLELCRELARRKAVLASVIHHLWGLAPEHIAALHQASGAREALLWLHDFATVCESHALLRNDIVFCGAPAPGSSACMICAHGAARPRHLERIRGFFEAISPTVLAPSRTVLELWTRQADVASSRAEVLPLASLVPLPTPAIGRPLRRRLRVAHLGARAMHKGWPVFADLAERFAGDGRYEFLQIGVNDALPLTEHVRHIPARVRPGDPTAMTDAVIVEEIDVVVNWSFVFETFSFVTYEALAGGAFVITHPRSGNVWPAICDNAPRQGYRASDEEELRNLFATDRLRDLLAESQRRRHLLVLGGASSEWLLTRNAGDRGGSLRSNG